MQSFTLLKYLPIIEVEELGYGPNVEPIDGKRI
jgi:hypothetical protein